MILEKKVGVVVEVGLEELKVILEKTEAGVEEVEMTLEKKEVGVEEVEVKPGEKEADMLEVELLIKKVVVAVEVVVGGLTEQQFPLSL